MHPKIKFEIKSKKDVETFFAFLRDSKYDNGRSFDWAVLKYHPFFKKFRTKSGFKIENEIVQKYVNDFYNENKNIIKKNINLYEKNWRKKEKIFYKLVNKLFPKDKWPKGQYIAYATMWSMFPRFLEDKTFQIPHKYKDPKYVDAIIAHEMLHFIFYDYFYKNYPKYKTGKHNFLVWHVSEIFNVLVQNSDDWMKVFKIKSMAYPEHEKIVEKLEKKYKIMKLNKTDDLIDDIIKTVKDSQLMQ